MQIIYDLETYPNYFLFGAKVVNGPVYQFEISPRRDEWRDMMAFLGDVRLMIGFNNLAFDYPILHGVMINGQTQPHAPALWYPKVCQIIASQTLNERWEHHIWDRDRIIPQMDLFMIHHFDNATRRTSLKSLQFAMRMESVEDLPIAPGSILTNDEMDITRKYNVHDLDATEKFFHLSQPEIEFRAALGPENMNYNDTKIGKKFLIRELEAARPGSCFTRERRPRQTPRPNGITLNDIIFPYIGFQHPELKVLLAELKTWTIHDTKGAFKYSLPGDAAIQTRKNLSVEINGMVYHFGTGGLHSSAKSLAVVPGPGEMILDMDVSGYYPSVAVVNRLYPEHLGELFCDKMHELRVERALAGKKSAKGKALKLAGNGAYGDSNNPHSPFFDPQYTMATTINGQLLLCMLAETLIGYVPGLEIIQANTDGITVKFKTAHMSVVDQIRTWWQDFTQLELESVAYSKMFVRDVNNYIAVKSGGGVKRVGAYEYEGLGWHKDHGALVIQRAAEAAMLHGVSVDEFVRDWHDPYDFMMLAKSPKLITSTGEKLPKHVRFYASTGPESVEIIKVMAPLAGKTGDRHIKINKGRRSTICNRIDSGFKLENVDLNFYAQRARKLVIK